MWLGLGLGLDVLGKQSPCLHLWLWLEPGAGGIKGVLTRVSSFSFLPGFPGGEG